MKIFIICSKRFYDQIPEIQKKLEDFGHEISLPNGYEDPRIEERYQNLGPAEHAAWKAQMLKHSTDVIEGNDAVLVLNYEKNGIENYIGRATFLEMYDAFRMGKKIYLFHPVPEGILRDEIIGFNPVIVNESLELI